MVLTTALSAKLHLPDDQTFGDTFKSTYEEPPPWYARYATRNTVQSTAFRTTWTCQTDCFISFFLQGQPSRSRSKFTFPNLECLPGETISKLWPFLFTKHFYKPISKRRFFNTISRIPAPTPSYRVLHHLWHLIHVPRWSDFLPAQTLFPIVAQVHRCQSAPSHQSHLHLFTHELINQASSKDTMAFILPLKRHRRQPTKSG